MYSGKLQEVPIITVVVIGIHVCFIFSFSSNIIKTIAVISTSNHVKVLILYRIIWGEMRERFNPFSSARRGFHC
jgi:ABC-type bacteriocin/lantibiotic exporter with double-glycine peptidase domain